MVNSPKDDTHRIVYSLYKSLPSTPNAELSRDRFVRYLALRETAVECAIAVWYCESPFPLEVMGQMPAKEPKEMGQLQTEAEIQGQCPDEKSNIVNTHLKRPLLKFA